MSRSPDTIVLIAGAGAAGLTLAIELARRNVPFRLIDKALAPFPGSRGKGIQPRTQEVFEDMGVLDRMAAIGGPYPSTRTYGGDGFTDAVMFERQPETSAIPFGQPLMLAQNLTERVLRERLAEFGAAPEFGCELTAIEQDEDGVTAHLKRGGEPESLRVSFLVGADGGTSFVRHTLGIGFPGETRPGRGLVADVAIAGLSRDVWHMWNADKGFERLGLCPLAGTDLFQLQTGLPSEGEVDLSDASLAALVATRTRRRDLVISSVRWRSTFGINARVAETYRVGRVLLAGDAAHVHPPAGGQGLNTSVQDAYALGWRVAAVINGAPMALLDTYAEERRPVALGVLGLSVRQMEAAREGGDLRRGRDNHQLDLGYGESGLSLERRSRQGRLQAGDRAPDAICRGAGGQQKRLFEVFRGTQFTLLGFACTTPPPIAPRKGVSVHCVGPQGELRDERGEVAEAYDPDPGDWFLIRPDGYVGAILGAPKGALLDAYLDKVGLPMQS